MSMAIEHVVDIDCAILIVDYGLLPDTDQIGTQDTQQRLI